jgi:hypothetical protein
MTFMHIPNDGVARRAIGERRTDHTTASLIRAALQTPERQAAARALAGQHIQLATALRILGEPQRRRAPDTDVAASF